MIEYYLFPFGHLLPLSALSPAEAFHLRGRIQRGLPPEVDPTIPKTEDYGKFLDDSVVGQFENLSSWALIKSYKIMLDFCFQKDDKYLSG